MDEVVKHFRYMMLEIAYGKTQAAIITANHNRSFAIVCPNVKHLDMLVSRGVQPSQIIIGSEMKNGASITHVAFDEITAFTEAKYKILDEAARMEI